MAKQSDLGNMKGVLGIGLPVSSGGQQPGPGRKGGGYVDYVARRTTEGMSTKDIMRCLKRFVAREVYRHLRSAGILNSAGLARARS
ncbi:hypothetical protein ACFRIB_42295 [Streptomyces mirabilis]|uniref:hypothetical protein n=1 Tax=Streptomyces mirabilis TaxID=68239 RepID=UPI00368BBE60